MATVVLRDRIRSVGARDTMFADDVRTKQREDSRSLEAMRKQIIANEDLDSAPAKRFFNENIESESRHQFNEAAAVSDSKTIQPDGFTAEIQGLEHTIEGTSLYVVGPHDDLGGIKEDGAEDMKSMISRIDKSGVGVYVQASTLGSLEALLELLKTPAVNVPVGAISLGPVHKKDVMKASVMLEKKKEYGTILAFDAKVTPEARELADELGVKIFTADIIHHLLDQFMSYLDNLKEEENREASDEAIFPCILLPIRLYNKKGPIALMVDVIDGIAKVGTPVCIPRMDCINIGRIASIQDNHGPLDYAKKGQKVDIEIIGSTPEEQQMMVGTHFGMEHEMASRITRRSLDALKENYADVILADGMLKLLFILKRLYKIP